MRAQQVAGEVAREGQEHCGEGEQRAASGEQEPRGAARPAIGQDKGTRAAGPLRQERAIVQQGPPEEPFERPHPPDQFPVHRQHPAALQPQAKGLLQLLSLVQQTQQTPVFQGQPPHYLEAAEPLQEQQEDFAGVDGPRAQELVHGLHLDHQEGSGPAQGLRLQVRGPQQHPQLGGVPHDRQAEAAGDVHAKLKAAGLDVRARISVEGQLNLGLPQRQEALLLREPREVQEHAHKPGRDRGAGAGGEQFAGGTRRARAAQGGFFGEEGEEAVRREAADRHAQWQAQPLQHSL